MANYQQSRPHKHLLLANLYSDLDGPQSPIDSTESATNPLALSLYDEQSQQTQNHLGSLKQDSKLSHALDGQNEIKRKSGSDTDQTSEVTTKKRKLAVKFSMRGYYAERRGEREEMQDRHVILDHFSETFNNLHDTVHRLALYGVFDGHGGLRASIHASEHLPGNIRTCFPKGDMEHIQKNVKRTFIEAFKKTDDDFLKEASKRKPSWKDGTTAICVLAINDILYIGNLGDSKAVLCRYSNDKYTAVPLSVDHSPSVYDERKRIQKCGGHVAEGRVMGILEVSRSIGDGQYKNHGVICTPDVKRCQLTDNDRFIVLACDGLWKTFTSQETIDLVNKTLDEPDDPASSLKERYEVACNKLVSRAVLRLSADNVTVVLVALQQQDVSST